MEYKDLFPPEQPSINFVGIVFTLAVIGFFCWFFWRYLFNLFDCEVIQDKLCIKLFSRQIFSFPVSSIKKIKRVTLLEVLANPFAIRLTSYSFFFRPSIMIMVNRTNYIITPRKIDDLDTLAEQIEAQTQP